jgi:hypothetical protein
MSSGARSNPRAGSSDRALRYARLFQLVIIGAA